MNINVSVIYKIVPLYFIECTVLNAYSLPSKMLNHKVVK